MNKVDAGQRIMLGQNKMIMYEEQVRIIELLNQH